MAAGRSGSHGCCGEQRVERDRMCDTGANMYIVKHSGRGSKVQEGDVFNFRVVTLCGLFCA